MVDRWFRKDGYSSDGFFLIKTELENDYLKKQTVPERLPDLKSLVERTINGMFTKLHKVEEKTLDDVSGITLAHTDDVKIVKFTSEDGDFDVVINKSYLHYFKGIKNLSFEGTGSLNPIVVRSNDEFVGLIMPIRTS